MPVHRSPSKSLNHLSRLTHVPLCVTEEDWELTELNELGRHKLEK